MRIAIPYSFLLGVLLLAGCTYNPATGRNQYLSLSNEEEIAIGEQAMPELIKEYGGEVQSAPLKAYVNGIGRRLAKQVEPQYADLPWEFICLDSDVINAFALPGGKVFFSRGLLDRLSNEAQVAAVLGHEIGHVTSQHIDERITTARTTSTVGSVLIGAAGDGAAGAVASVIVGAGGQGYLLKFGRNQEAEADVQGVKYMVATGYDPAAMLGVLDVLKEASKGAKPPEFLSTHPHPETRIATVNKLLKGEYAYTQNSSDFRQYPGRFDREARPYLSQ